MSSHSDGGEPVLLFSHTIALTGVAQGSVAASAGLATKLPAMTVSSVVTVATTVRHRRGLARRAEPEGKIVLTAFTPHDARF
jgi:hypothetical protein